MVEADTAGRDAFNVMYSVTTFNMLAFPIGLLAKQVSVGFNDSPFETIFWFIGTFWQTSVWGMFLLIFTVSPTAIFLAFLPFIFSTLVVWPVGSFVLNATDEEVYGEEADGGYQYLAKSSPDWGIYDDYDDEAEAKE